MNKKKVWLIILIAWLCVSVIVGVFQFLGAYNQEATANKSACQLVSSKLASSMNHMKELGYTESKDDVVTGIKENIRISQNFLSTIYLNESSKLKYDQLISTQQTWLDALESPELTALNEEGLAKLDELLAEIPNLCPQE